LAPVLSRYCILNGAHLVCTTLARGTPALAFGHYSLFVINGSLSRLALGCCLLFRRHQTSSPLCG
jgi:hypothetical protein